MSYLQALNTHTILPQLSLHVRAKKHKQLRGTSNSKVSSLAETFAQQVQKDILMTMPT